MKKFSFSITFILIWLWLLFVLGFRAFLGYVLATLFHEIGHYITAKKLGYKLSKFSLSGYGVSLSYLEEKVDPKEEVFIALAGPATNLLSAVLVCGIWWLFPTIYFFSHEFVFCNIILGLVNLLPAYPLDGGRIFTNITGALIKEKTSKKITFLFNLTSIFVFFTFFIVSCFKNFNPTLLLFSVFLVGGLIELHSSTRYEKINIFQKRTKKFAKMSVLSVDEDTQICQLIKKMTASKTVLFCLCHDNGRTIFLSEKMVLKLASNYPPNTILKQIFKMNFYQKKQG